MARFVRVQVIELFHVAFLDALSKRVDRSRYVLKGGANLRYFFASLRYSEDLDLDLKGEPAWRLRGKVDEILRPGRGPLHLLLRSAEVRVAEANPHKQTETTQRWKLALEHAGEIVRTKIEFSNRNGDDRYRLDVIPEAVVAPYALRAPTVQRYIDDAPTEQKIAALALRSETQARDVFDLDLLLRRSPLPAGSLDSNLLTSAAEIALELPYEAFRDQVLPFLEDEARELYEGEEAWQAMQAFVAEALERAR
jgi:Nucleotidyl transferase AbiEii toxin, Type IV TA system